MEAQQTKLGGSDENGRWIVMPNARRAAAHATPFPDFGDDVEIGMAVHDINLRQMQRITEQEADQ